MRHKLKDEKMDYLTSQQAFNAGFAAAVAAQKPAFAVVDLLGNSSREIAWDYILYDEIPADLRCETYAIGLNDCGNPEAKQI